MSEESKDNGVPPAKKILVVDDDEDLLAIYKIALNKTGYDVVAVDDGYKALHKISSFKPDLVILDLMMPNCSGFEVLIKLQDLHPRPSVIIVTGAHKDHDTIKRMSMEPMVVDFLFKPVNPSVIVEKVQKAVQPKAA